MNAFKLMDIMKKYEQCPKCGSNTIGKGQGGVIVDDNTFTRSCKCGFKMKVNEDGEEIS